MYIYIGNAWGEGMLRALNAGGEGEGIYIYEYIYMYMYMYVCMYVEPAC
jgi:hypothetical protein